MRVAAFLIQNRVGPPFAETPHAAGWRAVMLQPMQQPAASPPPSPSFAGMLTAFAAPGWKRPPARDLDGLEDDVATLTYERALRAHARYRAPEPGDRALTLPVEAPANAEVVSIFEVMPVSGAGEEPEAAQAAVAFTAAAEAEPEPTSRDDRNLKSASITIRMSKAECAQLRKRAAEAGLTMSAYLRSCTFEAESLRALVKDTLAQLRSDPSAAQQHASVPRRRTWRQWLAHLWPQPSAPERTAQA